MDNNVSVVWRGHEVQNPIGRKLVMASGMTCVGVLFVVASPVLAVVQAYLWLTDRRGFIVPRRNASRFTFIRHRLDISSKAFRKVRSMNAHSDARR